MVLSIVISRHLLLLSYYVDPLQDQKKIKNVARCRDSRSANSRETKDFTSYLWKDSELSSMQGYKAL